MPPLPFPIYMDRVAPGQPLPSIPCPKVRAVAEDTMREGELLSRQRELLDELSIVPDGEIATEPHAAKVFEIGAINIALEAIRRRARVLQCGSQQVQAS